MCFEIFGKPLKDFNQRRDSQSTFQKQLQLNGECKGSLWWEHKLSGFWSNQVGINEECY